MNMSAPLGLLVGLGVVGFATTQGLESSAVFLDAHAAIIVIGGTLAAAMICIPIGNLLRLAKVFVRTMLGKQQQETLNTINEIVEVAKSHYNGQAIADIVTGVKNHFLKESLELVASGGLKDAQLHEVLEMRVEQQNEMYRKEGATYKIIGKFPPAFGLVGATLGMIALLQGLGSPDAFQKLGPSMSVALVATFYGLILANVFIIPMGENLTHAAEEDLTMRRIVSHGVMLIKEKEHPLVVAEYLRSYLAPKQRNRMKEAA
ncbi:MAG TPA: MotA/TolQ/ExbB proton channel family protein [Bdellovibrionota bacterium]|nr:MotA/TolQ/ExbB proton channel family protein [Bdellovibrionota bacterium]